jgi:hypothetical protein
MLTPEGTLPFKMSRAKTIFLKAGRLSSFKNFPETIICPVTASNNNCFMMSSRSFDKITSLEGFPKYCKGTVALGPLDKISFHNVHKHILEADKIIIDGRYEGPLLGFLKIQNLKSIVFSGFVKNEKVSKAIQIVNTYLPLGNVLACQEELIDNDLKDYAEI